MEVQYIVLSLRDDAWYRGETRLGADAELETILSLLGVSGFTVGGAWSGRVILQRMKPADVEPKPKFLGLGDTE